MKKIFCCFFAVLVLMSSALAASGDTLVYVTRTGECYHRSGCSYLKSSREVTLDYAVDHGYRPCSRCSPPRLDSSSRSVPTTAPTKAPSRSYSSGSSSSSRSYSSSLPVPSYSSESDSMAESIVILESAGAVLIVLFILFSKNRVNISGFICGVCLYLGFVIMCKNDPSLPVIDNSPPLVQRLIVLYFLYFLIFGVRSIYRETEKKYENLFLPRFNRLFYLASLIYFSSMLPGCEILFIRILYISVFVFYFFAHWIDAEKIYKEGS